MIILKVLMHTRMERKKIDEAKGQNDMNVLSVEEAQKGIDKIKGNHYMVNIINEEEVLLKS